MIIRAFAQLYLQIPFLACDLVLIVIVMCAQLSQINKYMSVTEPHTILLHSKAVYLHILHWMDFSLIDNHLHMK